MYEDPDHHALSNRSSAYRRDPQGDFPDRGSNLVCLSVGLSETSIERTAGHKKHSGLQDIDSSDGHRKLTYLCVQVLLIFFCRGTQDPTYDSSVFFSFTEASAQGMTRQGTTFHPGNKGSGTSVYTGT